MLIGDAILASYAYRDSPTFSGIGLIQWMMVAIFGILGAMTLLTASIIGDNPSRTDA